MIDPLLASKHEAVTKTLSTAQPLFGVHTQACEDPQEQCLLWLKLLTGSSITNDTTLTFWPSTYRRIPACKAEISLR
jgi:hypothetical protein